MCDINKVALRKTVVDPVKCIRIGLHFRYWDWHHTQESRIRI